MDATLTLTSDFARALHALAHDPLPADVREVARRSLVNVLGTAIGASHDPAVQLLVDFGMQHGGEGSSAVLGRDERLDLLNAAVVNGFSAHLDDFDDTHLMTVIHPGAATMAAVLGIAAQRGISGERLLTAFAIGCEAQLRVGVAMSPEHYDDGWHITGTCAPIGGAVAAGIVLGLDAEQLTHAIGLAASQTIGQREGFGTMVKPFHAGKGAANGLHAALLAEQGFTAPTDALEDPRGYFAVLSPNGSRAESVVEGIGERYELRENTFKPYPCGIVTHPAIDAGIALSDHVADVADVVEVVARVHPLVVELTGAMEPRTGLEGKFSTAHGIAAGLVDGKVGVAQYRDDRVLADDLTQLRAKVRFEVDDGIRRDEAVLELVLADGVTHSYHTEHARGSRSRLLTDDELRTKLHDLVDPVLPGRTDALFRTVEELDDASTIDRLIEVTTRDAEVSA